MTTDPRLVREARVLPTVSYLEAMESPTSARR